MIIMFKGEDTIVDAPTDLAFTEDDDFITHTWSHAAPDGMIDHYNISFNQGQEIRVASRSIIVPRFPGLEYSASLHAVDVCGRRSANVEFSSKFDSFLCLFIAHNMPECKVYLFSYPG